MGVNDKRTVPAIFRTKGVAVHALAPEGAERNLLEDQVRAIARLDRLAHQVDGDALQLFQCVLPKAEEVRRTGRGRSELPAHLTSGKLSRAYVIPHRIPQD